MSKLIAPTMGKVLDYQAEGVKALEVCKKLLAEDGIALPSDAWLSGQAFASMVAGKKVVINDIDVFKVTNYRNLGSDEMIQKNFKRVIAQADSYSEWIGVGEQVKYKVVATTHAGLMNLTNIEFGDAVLEAKQGITLVEHFDINSTQCAINTTTKEVVFTKAFESYCESNVLEITNLSTVGHSLIRLVKKADELNAECNFAKEFDKFLGLHLMRNPFFGERLYGIYLKYKDVFDEYGVVPEECEFEERKYPLYKMERFSNPLQRWIPKAFHCEESKHTDSEVFGSIQSNLNKTSECFFNKTDIEISETVKLIQELETEEKLKTGFLVDRFPFVKKYFNEILSTSNGKDELKRLYQAIDNSELFFATVYNGSETFSEALEWIDILENPLAHKYVKNRANQMVQSTFFITKEEALENLAPFSVKEFIDSVPSIGESDPDKAGIVAVYENFYIIEMEYNEDSVEIFGLELKEGKKPVYDSKIILHEYLYDAKVFQTPTAFISSDCEVINEDEVRNHITPKQIPEIDIDSKEIPF